MRFGNVAIAFDLRFSSICLLSGILHPGNSNMAKRIYGLNGKSQMDTARKTCGMSDNSWRLNFPVQCAKCPWRVDTNPFEIPRGYNVEKHKALKSTIAKPCDVASLRNEFIRAMACHDHHEEPCVGWLNNQLGPGNNILLRFHFRHCVNGREMRVIGDQHENLEDTIPDE